MTCLHCGAATIDGITLCDAGDLELSTILGAIPGMLDDLDVTRLRQGRLGIGGRRSSVRPLPWHEGAALACRALSDQTIIWARYLGWRPDSTKPDPYAACAWLYGHGSLIRASQAAGTILSRLRAAYARAVKVVDRPVMLFAGPCWGCETPLYVEPDAVIATCRQCGEPHDVARLRDHLLALAEDRLGTVTECASMLTAWAGLPASVDAVQGYVRRGELVARGHVIVGGRTVARYRFGDVLDLARRAERRRVRRTPEPRVPPGPPTPAVGLTRAGGR